MFHVDFRIWNVGSFGPAGIAIDRPHDEHRSFSGVAGLASGGRFGRVAPVPAGLYPLKRIDSGAVVFGVLLAWLCACASSGPNDRCDLEGVDWKGLRAETPLRAHVRLVSGENDLRLDVVARTNEEELVVVGLTHYGVKIFVVRQRDDVVRIEETISQSDESLATKVLYALRHGLTTPAVTDEGKPISIRYDRNGLDPRFEIEQPQCGYEASVVRVSPDLPARKAVVPEGVEP